MTNLNLFFPRPSRFIFVTTMSSSIPMDKINASVATCMKAWASGRYSYTQMTMTHEGKGTPFLRFYTILPKDVAEVIKGDSGAWYVYLRSPVGKLAQQQLDLAMNQAVSYLQASTNPDDNFLAASEAGGGVFSGPLAIQFDLVPCLNLHVSR